MHIMEGFLPHPWWEIWFLLTLPVVSYGVYKTALKSGLNLLFAVFLAATLVDWATLRESI